MDDGSRWARRFVRDPASLSPPRRSVVRIDTPTPLDGLAEARAGAGDLEGAAHDAEHAVAHARPAADLFGKGSDGAQFLVCLLSNVCHSCLGVGRPVLVRGA